MNSQGNRYLFSFSADIILCLINQWFSALTATCVKKFKLNMHWLHLSYCHLSDNKNLSVHIITILIFQCFLSQIHDNRLLQLSGVLSWRVANQTNILYEQHKILLLTQESSSKICPVQKLIITNCSPFTPPQSISQVSCCMA